MLKIFIFSTLFFTLSTANAACINFAKTPSGAISSLSCYLGMVADPDEKKKKSKKKKKSEKPAKKRTRNPILTRV